MDIQAMSRHWIKFLSCLLVLLGTQAHAQYGVPITIVENAVEKGAVCLDGSPPAYYHDKGIGENANNWVLFLQGGAWCLNTTNCMDRATGDLGSSFKMTRNKGFHAILNSTQAGNPQFYTWNRVFVPYCDGASFAGEVEEVDPKTNLHFRGARVFKAVVEDLLAKGMKDASNVILSGQSAGGLATILHCDRFRSQVPKTARVKCLADAGLFLYGKDIPGATNLTMEQPFFDLVGFHGIDKLLPKSCTSKMDAKLCLYPENLVGDIQTPLFIVNSAFDNFQVPIKVNNANENMGHCQFDAKNCTSSQLKVIQGFRTSMLKALPKGDCRSKGMFIDSIIVHDHIVYDDRRWYGPKAPLLKNKTVSEAFADWFFERSCFQEIDPNDHPQNCLT